MERNECIAMLLAGGQGSRLGAMTQDIAKPGLSFGGKYRIIDFSLSNCTNSGIETVGVLTQYKPFLLNTYVGIGSAWDLDRDQGGMHVLPPYMSASGGAWYKGTANAIYQNMEFIDNYDPEYVLILSGDHIYKMDYSKMLEVHKDNEADLTIAVLEVPDEETSRFGIMTVDDSDQIIKFTEKPKNADSNLASMGIYIFTWDVLKKALIADEADEDSDNDFGKNIIPKLLEQKCKLMAHRFVGYWKDVGTVTSYYETNMELLEVENGLDIFDTNFRIASNADILPPQFIGVDAKVDDSLISNGCTVLGTVKRSILGPGVYVAEGAEVVDSILLPYSKVGSSSTVVKTILGEKSSVGERCMLGAKREDEEQAKNNGICVVGNSCILNENMTIFEGDELRRHQ